MLLEDRSGSRPAARLPSTLARSVTLEGTGLHTGAPCRATVEPHEEPGYRFCVQQQEIPACVHAVTGTARCTTLGAGGVSVSTVEHLLSALAGLEIDAARIRVEGPELPILDGSAAPWVQALNAAGRQPLARSLPCLNVDRPLHYAHGRASYLALPAPPGALWITFISNSEHPALRLRTFSAALDPNTYAREVAPARTWAFREELDALFAAGLARGGSLDNALVLDGCETSSPLRLPDEPVRHKALDLLGDLALAGARIQGHLLCVGGGHTGNVAFAAALTDAFPPASSKSS